MAYEHGVYIEEQATSLTPPVEVASAVQIIIGTTPVNLADDPNAAVNKPVIAYSFREASEKVGYSDDFEKFTACQSIDASFRVFNVAPIIIVNVLDPEQHNIAVTEEIHAINRDEVVIEEEGIMLNEEFVVKSEDGTTTYDKGADYEVSFNDDGFVKLEVIEEGSIDTASETSLSFDYTQLDPDAITKEDIIGGYDNTTGRYKGLENVEQVFPRLSMLPGLILAPGWSHNPSVAIAMTAKTTNINEVFSAVAIADIDSSETNGVVEYSEVAAWKNDNGYNDKNLIAAWPKVTVGDKVYYYSAILGPLTAFVDDENGGVPYVTPSNKSARITGTVLESGEEVYLGQGQANSLNGNGIITAINWRGWKAWGSRTSVYPSSTDPKDSFIPVRRMFVWWGNTFIETYFQRVDDPLNRRLIENVVDSENIRANGFKARQQIAGARMEYLEEENPLTDIIDGKIRFHQYLTPFPPARSITNVLEFDPYALQAQLGGE
jgi:hypothetical protein